MNVSARTGEVNAEKLVEAFASFSQVSTSLEKTFNNLQNRVRDLSRELERTNDYLVSVLQSLPCGVVVLDGRCEVTTINERAADWFGLQSPTLPQPLLGLLGDHPQANLLMDALHGKVEGNELTLQDGREVSVARSGMRGSGTVVVIQDVTRLRRLQEEMRRSEALAAMGEMAVEIAHEIRNPLGSLELFASLMGRAALSSKERKSYAENIRIGVRSLNNVVSNMLSFSRECEPCTAATRIDDLIDEILNFMSPLLEQRKIEVVRRFRNRRPIQLDRQMIGQALTNLVSNALRALPCGGRIVFESEDRGDEIAVRIRDNGVGIPAEHRKRIFDARFTTHPSGTGLGLAIVARAVRAHDAVIEVSSREGRGSQFEIRFPAEERA